MRDDAGPVPQEELIEFLELCLLMIESRERNEAEKGA
jgi:hypothetical protein